MQCFSSLPVIAIVLFCCLNSTITADIEIKVMYVIHIAKTADYIGC